MRWSDRLFLVAALCGALFLAFLAGGYVVLAGVFPARLLEDAHRAGKALIAQRNITNRFTQTDLWRRARTDDRGVTVHDPRAAYPGYTLYTSGGGTHALLVDMAGNRVHRWSLNYSELWDAAPGGRPARPDDLMYWRKARVLPNGDLVAIFVAAGDTPWGYGLVKLDRGSRVLWSRHVHAHHDFDIAGDGRILALTHDVVAEPPPRFGGVDRHWLEDYLLVLGAGGETLARHPLTASFLSSPYRKLLDSTPHFARTDPLHTNSVQWIDESAAAASAVAESGQALVSFRHPGVVALLDAASGRMTWATRGPWLGQHYARALPDGRIVLFDNHSNFVEDNQSRIVEFDPADMAITWRYAGTARHPFDSRLRGAVETLPNGNRLITESDGGRIFEVDRDGAIVWEFVNPVRGGEDGAFIPVVSAAQRIAADALDPDFRAFLEDKSR